MEKINDFMVALGLGCLSLMATVSCVGQVTAPPVLAIVAEPNVQALADLLVVELSRLPDCRLVDRSRLDLVAREKFLAGGLDGYIECGRILGADGLIVLSQTGKDSDRLTLSRCIAVNPGVIMSLLAISTSAGSPETVVGQIRDDTVRLLPKLRVAASDRVPVTFLGFHSPLVAMKGTEVETMLNLLMTRRLVSADGLFVLERWRTEDVLWEQQMLRPNASSPFWDGSHIIDGTVQRVTDGDADLRVSIALKSRGERDARTFEISGPATNLAGMVVQLAENVTTMLLDGATVSAWAPSEEADVFLCEARWAARCERHRDAYTAADTAWVLGNHSEETALLRVLSRCLSLSIVSYEKVPGTSGPFSFRLKRIESAEAVRAELPRVIRMLELGLEMVSRPPSVSFDSRRIAEATISCVLGASWILRDAYDLNMKLPQDRLLIEEARTAIKNLYDALCAGVVPGREYLYYAAGAYGAFWYDSAEGALEMYRHLFLKAPDMAWVEALFLGRGMTGSTSVSMLTSLFFEGESLVRPDILLGGDVASENPPRLVDWESFDGAAMQVKWGTFLASLKRSTSFAEQYFGWVLSLQREPASEEEAAAFRVFLKTHEEAIFRQSRLLTVGGGGPAEAVIEGCKSAWLPEALRRRMAPDVVSDFALLLGLERAQAVAPTLSAYEADIAPGMTSEEDRRAMQRLHRYLVDAIRRQAVHDYMANRYNTRVTEQKKDAFMLTRFWKAPFEICYATRYQDGLIWVIGRNKQSWTFCTVDPATLETLPCPSSITLATDLMDERGYYSPSASVSPSQAGFVVGSKAALFDRQAERWRQLAVPPVTYSDIVVSGTNVFLAYTHPAGPAWTGILVREKAILLMRPDADQNAYDPILSSTQAARIPAFGDMHDFDIAFLLPGRPGELIVSLIARNLQTGGEDGSLSTGARDPYRIVRYRDGQWEEIASSPGAFEYIPSGPSLLLGKRIGDRILLAGIPSGEWPDQLFDDPDAWQGSPPESDRRAGIRRFVLEKDDLPTYTHKAFDGENLWCLPVFSSDRMWCINLVTGVRTDRPLVWPDPTEPSKLLGSHRSLGRIHAVPGGLLLLSRDGFWFVDADTFCVDQQGTRGAKDSSPEESIKESSPSGD